METINVTLEKLLAFRKAKNLELFMNDVPGVSEIEFYVQSSEGIIMKAVSDPKNILARSVYSKTNTAIQYYDKRIETHDFTDSTSWADPAISTFRVEPSAGMKLLVSSIQVRFPEDIQLTVGNELFFKVYKYIPGMGLVPVITLEYKSVRELIKKLNTPLIIPFSIVADISTKKLVEVSAQYSDPNTLKGSPIVLSSVLGEYMEMGLTGNTQLQNVSAVSYDAGNECWSVVNGKQVLDF